MLPGWVDDSCVDWIHIFIVIDSHWQLLLWIRALRWHLCKLPIYACLHSLLQEHCLQRWHTRLVLRFLRYWRCAEPACLLRKLWEFIWITIQDCWFIVRVAPKWIFLTVIRYWLIDLFRHISEYHFLLIYRILKCHRLLLRLIVTLRLWRWLLALDIQLVRLLLNLPWLVEILNYGLIIDID